jgi:hypothetical protein
MLETHERNSYVNVIVKSLACQNFSCLVHFRLNLHFFPDLNSAADTVPSLVHTTAVLSERCLCMMSPDMQPLRMLSAG